MSPAPPSSSRHAINPRQTATLELLAVHGRTTIRALARRFHVSAMTIRRDCAALEARGELVRTHGGVALARAGVIEFAFVRRAAACAAEKRAIARAVRGHITPGMTIVLDTGTTTLEVARAIAGIPGLKVLTSSLAIASALYAVEGLELILLGGAVRKGSPDLSGGLTEENLGRFAVDLALLGADGVDARGLYTTDMDIARVSRIMIANAARRWLVLDHTKFERVSFVKFAEWRAIDRVITDAAVPRRVRAWLGRAVGDVVYAEC